MRRPAKMARKPHRPRQQQQKSQQNRDRNQQPSNGNTHGKAPSVGRSHRNALLPLWVYKILYFHGNRERIGKWEARSPRQIKIDAGALPRQNRANNDV
jgi:hypothetical protein